MELTLSRKTPAEQQKTLLFRKPFGLCGMIKKTNNLDYKMSVIREKILTKS